MGKYGEQMKNSGIQSLNFVLGSASDYLSFIKGTTNRACIFDIANEIVIHSKDYSDLYEKVDASLKSMHPITKPDDTPKTAKHILISDKGHITVDRIASKKIPKKKSLNKVSGDQVWKSFQSDFNQSLIAIC